MTPCADVDRPAVAWTEHAEGMEIAAWGVTMSRQVSRAILERGWVMEKT